LSTRSEDDNLDCRRADLRTLPFLDTLLFLYPTQTHSSKLSASTVCTSIYT